MASVSLSDFLNSSESYNLCYLHTSSLRLQESISFLRSSQIPVLNVGYQLSDFIRSLKNLKFLSVDVPDQIGKLLHAHKTRIPGRAVDIIALYNFGILLEPELDLNPVQILKEFSRSAAVILIWENESSSHGLLHWSSRKDIYSFDFSKTHIRKLDYAV